MWRETLQPAPAAPAAPAAPVAAAAAAPAAAALPKAGEDGNWYVPGDFDTVSFLKQAKEQFVRIQAVWDSGETDRLREFLTDDLIVELKPQLAERGGAANKTEVVLLNAELLGIETVSDGHLASVRFSGMLREAPAPRPSASRKSGTCTSRPTAAGCWPASSRSRSTTPAEPDVCCTDPDGPGRPVPTGPSGPVFPCPGAKPRYAPTRYTPGLPTVKTGNPAPWPLPIAFMLPLPFLPTPSRLATQALNMLLKREDWARERLVRHAGKTVRFALGGFSLA